FFTLAGFFPIEGVALQILGLCPLHRTVLYFLYPMLFVAITVGLYDRPAGWKALLGLGAGLVAVAAYDCLRLAFVFAGFMPDFIPHPGTWALNDPKAHWIWGYLWRFLLNGGGMGMTFALLPFRRVREGVAYGAFICLCLFGVLWLNPTAEQVMFPLRPL